MNRDELLTKLSMELAEWPQDLPGPNLPGLWSCHHVWRCHAIGDRKAIFEQDWLQRRAVLINKPDWSEAPEWAEWQAQDEDGHWHWYDAKPDAFDRQWDSNHGDRVSRAGPGTIPAGHGWQQTLERRPAFNESRADIIGQNGNDGSHYLAPENPFIRHMVETMTEDEQSMPAEQRHDCLRCGGSYYSPPHDECPCQSGRSDGSTASYYELPAGATELQDLISYRNLNAQDGEIFRAIYRKGRASHSDALRDAKKVLFYAKAEVQRLERYGR